MTIEQESNNIILDMNVLQLLNWYVTRELKLCQSLEGRTIYTLEKMTSKITIVSELKLAPRVFKYNKVVVPKNFKGTRCRTALGLWNARDY